MALHCKLTVHKQKHPALVAALAAGALLAAQTTAAAAQEQHTAAASATLPAISIQGTAPTTALSPVAGYVAERNRSATKTDTPLRRIPQDISVITADQIRAQNATSMSEVLRYTGGMITATSGTTGSSYDEFMLRGFAPTQYLDGLKLDSYYSYTMPKTDPYLLARVDVLKGPASVLYGQMPPGGAVNYVSKRPVAESHNEIFLQAGNHHQSRAGLDYGGALDAAGHLLYRLVAVGQRRHQPQDTVRSADINIAPALLWRIADTTELTLLAKYRHDPKGGTYSTLPYEGTVTALPGIGRIERSFYDGDASFKRFERTEYQIGYEFEHWFTPNIQFEHKLRYLHNRVDYRAIWAGGGLQPDGQTLGRFAEAARESRSGFSTDSHLLFEFDSGAFSHKLLAGIDYHRLRLDKNDTSFAAPMPPPISIVQPDHHQLHGYQPQLELEKVRQQQLGYYLQDQVSLGRLVLIGGARYDHVRTSNDTPDANPPGHARRSDHAVTARAGALYAFDSGWSPYVSYSESFQPPSNVGEADFTLSEPMKGQQYEIGIKYQPPGHDVLLTASAFDIHQRNVVEPLPGTRLTTQVGKVTVKGLDLDARASLANGLDLSAAVTYLHSSIRSSERGNKGNRMAQTPTYTASLWLDYTQPEGRWEGLGAGVGVRYVGSMHATNDNYFASKIDGRRISDRVPSHTLVDASIHYALDGLGERFAGWKTAINVHNLFDKKYVAACGGSFDRQYCNYGYGRQITASVSHAWD